MEWSMVDEWSSWPYDPYYPYYEEKNAPPVPAQHVPIPTQAQPYQPDQTYTLLLAPPEPMPPPVMPPKGESPREMRNKAEKQRRDKMNKSIAELARIVPPVVATGRKMDKTSVLKLTAHYLRAHQYVFGDSINSEQRFSAGSAHALLGLLKGFVLTTTYKGIVVVVSQNVQQYLGYTELELIGKSIFDYTHADDHAMLREQLMPKSSLLGTNGELLIPEGPDGTEKVADALAREKRRFVVRFKKVGQRSEGNQYVTCHVQGTLRKSDKASRNSSRCCQMVRRVRARGDNPRPCGNDVVFVGLVRPTTETFINESAMESFRMEYRTRHSIDGEIIECESRIALVTGYMTHEVNGVNAMNFMHRNDVRWVIIALREMYDQHRLVGESCYRLMTKNGKFIYMQTRGFLDVDRDSRAVTSFVCTNTVVDENVGKRLIKLMKKKFTLLVNNGNETAIPDDDDDSQDLSDSQLSPIPVEDPRQLQKVILHLVTNLPSPQPSNSDITNSPNREDSYPQRLAIIPPRRERIVSAIEKIYSVIKPFNKEPIQNMDSSKEGDDEIRIDITNSDSSSETTPATVQNQQPLDPYPELTNLPPAAASSSMNYTTQSKESQIFRSRNYEFETPVASTSKIVSSAKQSARIDRPIRTSSSRTRRGPNPDSNSTKDGSHIEVDEYYPQTYVPPDHHFAPIDAPSTSSAPQLAGSSQSIYEPEIDYSNYGIHPSLVDENPTSNIPSTPKTLQLWPRSMSNEENNNSGYSYPFVYSDISTPMNSPASTYGSSYMSFRNQFQIFRPSNYNRHPNYSKPHTQTSETMTLGGGTKRQSESFTQEESTNKKVAQNIFEESLTNPEEEVPLPTKIEEIPLPAFREFVPLPMTNTATTLSIEDETVSITTTMEAVTTCYANATMSTASATYSMAIAQGPEPLFIAQESNILRYQGNEDTDTDISSSSSGIVADKPEESQDSNKIEIDESMLRGNSFEPSIGEDSLDQTLEPDFPNLKVLAECEKLEEGDFSENSQ